MSIFGSILGAVAGPVVGGLIGSLGSDKASRQEFAGARAAQQAYQPEPLDRASQNLHDIGIQGAQSYITQLNRHQSRERENRELQRLQALRAPSIEQARSRLQAQLLNRGRLGVGTAGGMLSGRVANPETAALEEGILRAQLGDISAARQFSHAEQQNLLSQAQGLTGIAARLKGSRFPPNAGIAALQAQPYANQAASTRGFFSSIGQGLSNVDYGGLFDGGGGGYSEGIWT